MIIVIIIIIIIIIIFETNSYKQWIVAFKNENKFASI